MSNVILLNGCSSAGKTTLALALQNLLCEPYQHIALDQFRDGMPGRVRGLNSPPGDPGASGLNVVPGELNGKWVTHIQFGDYGERVLAAMRRTVATLSELGCNVIVDDLLFKRDYLEDYAAVVDPQKTWFVGVKCSLDVINEREALRPGRFPGTARAHFEQVHEHGVTYDLEVDTSAADPAEVAQTIAQRLQQPPLALQSLRQ
ncbi:MAG: AAA family ATPase [Proteobacteria bacterium]|nr:AAA family ATPase [Pseudomonadota bacterium]